jgi:hypothetical protein
VTGGGRPPCAPPRLQLPFASSASTNRSTSSVRSRR